jgi:preprotein translocase subunit SecE
MAEEKKVKKDRTKWLREMKSELKKIVWPTKQTTLKNTATVLVGSLCVGVFVWIVDGVAVLAVTTLINAFGA